MANLTNSSTTSSSTPLPVTTTFKDNLTVHDGDPDAHPPSHIQGYRIAEFAVPMTVTVVVVIVLCAVIAYTKRRKRRQRLMAQQLGGVTAGGVASGGGATLPNTSNGVAMCGAAYSRPPVVVMGPVMPEMPPQPPAYTSSPVVPYDLPPSYEETVREGAGNVNVAFQSSSENLSIPTTAAVDANVDTTTQQQQQQQQQQQSASHKTDDDDLEVSVNSESDKASNSLEISAQNNEDRPENINAAENVESHSGESPNSIERTSDINSAEQEETAAAVNVQCVPVTDDAERRNMRANDLENVHRL